MKHKRFEENILVDEAYTNYGKVDINEDQKKGHGIAKHFAETLEYGERKKWFDQIPEEPSSSTKTPTQEQIEELKKEANNALFGDTMAYETKQTRSGSSDHQWAKTLLNKGAIQDRVAAATILIQDNPLYNLTALKNLVNNVKPAKKKDGVTIIDALSELFISDLLIPDAKLRTFEQHALGHIDEMTSGNKQARRNVLKLWHFEDQLKELYGTYVEALNKFAQDSVESNREKAVSSMSYLLMHHPEREKVLLMNIINKLGDPSTAVGSKVIYHLCQLLYNHPNMKAVVLTEIEKMLFRSNIAPRAQYYGICFLNQFYLGKDDSRVAENLIRIYFCFFKACIKKGSINTRLMSAILTGVKRAYPFADRERVAGPAHVDAIHKLVHLAPLTTAVHALALLAQIHTATESTQDRYYTALYRKLTSPDIFTTAHSALLFSLIYKSLSQDKNVARVAAFIKRLLQLAVVSAPAQAAALLILISHALKDAERKEASLVHTKCIEIKDEEPKLEKKEENSDTEVSRTEQNGTLNSTEDEVKEEIKEEQKKIDLLHGDKKDLLMDDGEESYVDLKIDDEGNVKPAARRAPAAVAGWHHAAVAGTNVELNVESEDKDLETKIKLKKTINMDKVIGWYCPLARNPSFAGALHSAYFELTRLAAHYHPTVKLFAEKLLNEQLIQYSGDPLKDFSGVRFLDRFVFKNPKKREEKQPEDGTARKVKGSHPRFAIRKNYTAKGLKSLPVNSASYLNEDVRKIPIDERFLYDFLRKRRSQQVSDDKDSDDDSVTSEDFEQYLGSFGGAKETAQSDEELDYLADMEANKMNRPRKTKDEDALSDDDDDDAEQEAGGDDDDDGSDGELNISGDDDEPRLSGDEDELLLQDSDDDDDDLSDMPKKNKLKLKGGDDLSSLFASAEEFSTLLEDTASNKKQGSSQAVSNADNSSTKQLAWEENRDKWLKGYNKKIHGKSGKKGGRQFNKTGNTNKMAGSAHGGKARKRNNGSADGGGGKKKKFK